jgi:hypothetical protein
MPVTRSETLFFVAGVAAGAAARKAYPRLKEKYGPAVASALAGARDALGDALANARRVAEARAGSPRDAAAGTAPPAS